jgi:hypothetical protein
VLCDVAMSSANHKCAEDNGRNYFAFFRRTLDTKEK